MTWVDPNRGFDWFTDIIPLQKQSAKQRFGKDFNLEDLSHQIGNNYDDGYRKDAPETLPQFEQHRMNLTALSQTHNLYFVAFRNQIYVYRPPNLGLGMPGKPHSVIRPPSLTLAPKPGSIYHDHPHCVNSMIVGDLGDLEILLVAFDDGDVFAFYIKDIDRQVWKRINEGAPQLIDMGSIFSENVGDSAWGLAIHKSLRIIAVSSNDKCIRLFCFDLIADAEEKSSRKFLAEQSSNWGSGWRKCLQIPLDRRYDARIDVSMKGLGCHNIPMLTFSNSEEFKDDVLVGQDIKGKVFGIQLRNMETILLPVCNFFHRGWASTFLDARFFMPIKDSPTDAFGNSSLCRRRSRNNLLIVVDGEKIKSFKTFGIKHDALVPPYHAILRCSERDVALHPINSPLHTLTNVTDWMPDMGDTFCRAPLEASSSFELEAQVTALQPFPYRMSMLIKIPELSTVIVGSVHGSVALLTATFLSDKIPHLNCGYGQGHIGECRDFPILKAGQPSFRLEGILPTKSQQENGDRPGSPLMGIAASPISMHGKELEGSPESPPRHFRLLLYYSDHTILSYDLSREQRVQAEPESRNVADAGHQEEYDFKAMDDALISEIELRSKME